MLGLARIQGYRTYSVASDSMSPAIRVGDAVMVRTGTADLHIGEIVSFPSQDDPQVIITHRIVGVNRSRGLITTKGDNAVRPDGPIRISDIIGMEKIRLPFIGKLIDLAKQPLGLAVAIYLPALSILVAELQRLTRYYTKYEPRRYMLYR